MKIRHVYIASKNERYPNKVFRSTIFFFSLILFLLNKHAYAQNIDQRAENIQNGLNTIFMSADKSYYKGNSASDNNPYGYGYWVTAHALETLADAYQRTRNNVYKDRMKSILAGIRKYNLYAAGTYRNDYYDDLEWLCLATFNCYNATKDPEFLNAVHDIWAEIKTGYTNGAMNWKKGCTTPCKNSIANGPAIIIAVKLYQLEGDNTNLQMAKDIHAWMKANVLNAQGGIWDSPDNHNPDWQFSYNSGMFIGACLELSIVTGAQSYIDDGIKASEFMMNYRNYNGGAFYLNEKGQGDGGLFKGIFAKWFTEFVRVGNLSQEYKERYLKVINYTGDYAWANSVNKLNNLISFDWGALPTGTIDLSTQASGVHLFESVASLNKVHVYQNVNYGGFYSQLAIGSYTLAQLQAKGVSDNDITSLTVPMGYSVTVYDGDNFTGTSKTFTENSGWLSDWNDKITSLKIIDTKISLVNVFQDINYGGYAAGLDIGNYTLSQLQSKGIIDNDITSLKISAGIKVTVYEGDNFTGTSKDFTADVNWLADWNDKISSIKITDIRPYVFTAFQDVNFGGYSAGFNIGDYTLIQLQAKGISDNDITSLKIAAGFKVTVYDGDNFTGASKDFTAETGWLADWNDKISSLRIQAIIFTGNGDGLSANYFNGMNFETWRYTTKDATLNMDWGTGTPNSAVNIDQFSARWTGQVQPKYSGEYTFYINSDNGRRVWVNGKLIVDKWVDDWNIEYAGKIILTAQQKYDIKVEYFENNGGANVKLLWSSTSQEKEIIPSSQLYSNPLPTTSVSASSTNAAAPANITLSANASDADGIAKVDFYNGTTLLASDNLAPYTYTWNNMTVGSYSVTALATDSKGGATLSSSVSININTTVNKLPTVSLTSPLNNANFNAPATLSIAANAADADGNISKVEFFNGNQKLGEDISYPYSYSWTNVAGGTYTIYAKATDNAGAIATSTGVSVTVNTIVVNNPCSSIVNYAENSGYAPGSIVQNAGSKYQCKPFPYSGWCNGAAWAYGPGTGAYWTDAWTSLGSCNARVGADQNSSAIQMATELLIAPNPVQNSLTFVSQQDLTGASVHIFNALGLEVLSINSYHSSIDVSHLPSGIYTVICSVRTNNIATHFIK